MSSYGIVAGPKYQHLLTLVGLHLEIVHFAVEVVWTPYQTAPVARKNQVSWPVLPLLDYGGENALMIHYIESSIRQVPSRRHEEVTAIIAGGEGFHDVPCWRFEVGGAEPLLYEAAALAVIVVLIAHIWLLICEAYLRCGEEGEGEGREATKGGTCRAVGSIGRLSCHARSTWAA